MRTHPLRTLIGTLVVVYGLLLVTIVTDTTPTLGLDLQGGISVNLQPVKDGQVTTDVSNEDLDDSIEIIRRRVDALGVAEPEVTRQGNTITVQLPGAKDQAEVLEVVGSTAKLEFRPVLGYEGQTISGEDREKAEEDVAALRAELGIPDDVTAEQVYLDEQTKQAVANPQPADDPSAGDPAAGAPAGEAPALVPDGEAIVPTPEDTSTGNGGNRSATAAAQADDAPADDAPADDAPADEETTTTVPVVPLNQWGIDVSDERFGRLAGLETSLAAELTRPEDRSPEAEVVLAGEDGTIYRLGPMALDGTAVAGATASLSEGGVWTVNPSFKEGADGIDRFNAIAAQCNAPTPEVCPGLSPADQSGVQRGLLGIVLDDLVLSAPAINEASFGRDQIQISGSFDRESAESLAVALRYGALPVELQPQQAENVSATLGQGALQAGIISGLIGLLLASLYLLLYYRLLALVAVAGLLVAASALYVIMASVGATVTLAGVVGIVVSIGVTVDSAVVYFETMKEQTRAGRSARIAADLGFQSAGSTIVKANIASIIGAGILYWLAVGPVRGFAFYLGAMSVLDLVMLYLFVYPATVLVARSRLGKHPAQLGLPEPQTPVGPAESAVVEATPTGAQS